MGAELMTKYPWFEVGQKVCWSSSANKTTTEKVGVIVLAIPRHTQRWQVQPAGFYGKYNWSSYGHGMTRDHRSYLVAVESGGKAKPRIYWPRVSALKLIEERRS